MTKWPRIIRKAGRIIAIILGSLLLLLLLLWIAIQRPAVQQFVADKITQSLSEQLQTPFSIQNIELKFFNRALLEGIYIEDSKGDTLLYAGRLEAQLGLFAPLRQQLEVKGISLDRALIQLSRNPDSVYNYQFLIDAFSTPAADTSQSSSAWTIDVNRIAIKDTRLGLSDSVSLTELYVKVGEFSGTLQQLNLPEQQLDIDQLHLKNSFCNFSSRAKPDTLLLSSSDTAIGLEFPFYGWKMSADQLQVENFGFDYDDFSQPPGPSGQFDPAHIDLEAIQLNIQSFNWTASELSATIQQLSFREVNGMELHNLTASLQMTPTNIALSELELETPESRLVAPFAGLRFPSFASLNRFVEEVDLDVQLSPSFFAIEDISYLGGPVPYLRTDYSGKIRLSGNLQGQVSNLSAEELYGELEDALRFKLNGYVRGLPIPDELSFGVNVANLQTSYRGLNRATEGLALPPGLDSLGTIRMSSYISGRINNFSARRLAIRTSGYTAFTGNFSAVGLPDVDNARFEVDIAEMRTQASELAGFATAALPPALTNLGKMQYQGQFAGTIYDFQLSGLLQSEQGQLEQDVSLQFNQDYSNANYKGQAALTGLELGALLGDTSALGAATMTVEGIGSGLSLDSLSANVDATIQSIVFQGYTYQDIRVNGDFKRQQFEGKINVDDPHLRFQFDGLADLNDTIPDFNFTLQLDTAELAYLNLYPSALRLSTTIEARLKGNTLDNLSGFAAIRRLSVADKKNKYFTDNITLNAYKRAAGDRVVRFDSDIAKAQLEGDYRIAELSGLLIEFIDGFFPIKKYIEPRGAADSLLVPAKYASQNFRFSAGLSKPIRLTRIFLPELQQLDTASFKGRFNSQERELEFSAEIPTLRYATLRWDSLLVSMRGSPAGLSNKFSFQSLETEGQTLMQYSQATAHLFQDSLTFRLNIQDDTAGQKLNLEGVVTAPNERYHLQFRTPLVLNNSEWAIPENNRVSFSPTYLNVNDLKLARNQQEFLIQSRDSPRDADFAPIDMTFNRFRLKELSRLIGLDSQSFSGALNGGVAISRPDSAYVYEANLNLTQLTLDSHLVGDIAFYAAPTPDQKELKLNAQLSGKQNAFSLDGNYGLADGRLGFNLEVERLQMAVADFFAARAFSNSQGLLRGELDVKGTIDAPEIVGQISLDTVSTLIEYLQARYSISGHTIQFRKNEVDLGRMELRDRNNNRAILKGQIAYQSLSDVQLDLNFSTASFQVLNTSAEDNSLFYGKIIAGIDADVDGPLDAPVISVYTKTLPGTQLTVLPLTEQEAIQQEDFILYGKPSDYESDSTNTQVYQTELLGYELNLQLDLNSDAQLIAVIDPLTGDKLTARGRANLLVEMDQSGRLTTNGDIYLTEGSYFFSYEGLVKRTFQIRPGSHIFLPGDPLDARFDVTAIYQTRASTYDLINQQAGLSPEEASAAKRRMEVMILMSLEGTLSEPEITFDIQLPEDQASAVATAVETKLAQLRENNTELNKQVFGLLFFNSFIAEQSGGTSLAEAGESIALSSVSNLITNQLNRLANQYVKGVDVELQLDSYRTAADERGSASTVTDVGLGLSKQLFDNRLSIKVGGTVGLGDDPGQEGATALASEFLLEYKLTEDGRYRVRVFRRPDYDIINTSNTVRTGVSILYKTSFGGIHTTRDTTNTGQ